MSTNVPTADASEEEVSRVNDKNEDKEGMKDNVTPSNINNHLRELNYGVGATGDNIDKMEEYSLPQKKKSRKSKKKK